MFPLCLECTAESFRCDGLCLRASVRCDGVNNCEDGLDEAGCGEYTDTPPSLYACRFRFEVHARDRS